MLAAYLEAYPQLRFGSSGASTKRHLAEPCPTPIDHLHTAPTLGTGNERESTGDLRFDPLDGADADVV